MKEYEISYIASPKLTEEARAEAASAVDTAITEAGGTISQNTEHERRRLGYPVENDRQGFLRTLGVSLKPESVEEIRQQFAKIDGVMRVQIVLGAYHSPVAPDILDAIVQQQKTPKKAAAPETTESATKTTKQTADVTMEQVEEKIEAALDEEVK